MSRFTNFLSSKYQVNIYFALAYRFALIMLFAQICRVGFYWFNADLFPLTEWNDLPQLLLAGLVFDLPGVLYVNMVFVFMQAIPAPFVNSSKYQFVSKWIYGVFNTLFITANVADSVYYRFTLRRTSALFFQEFAHEQDKVNMLWQIVADYWAVPLIIFVMVWLLMRLYRLVDVKGMQFKPLVYYPFATLMMLSIVTLFVGAVRGGFAHSTRPITISNATQYVNNIGEEGIVLNTPFSILRTIGVNGYDAKNYFSEEELECIYSPTHTAMQGDFTKKNVVFLILESFGKEYIGTYNKDRRIVDYKGYTPFLDSLIDKSIAFKYSLANGRKSIDAMASIFASIPAVKNSFILTPYSSNDLSSIFTILEDEGYNSSFFHGAPNGSMGFLAFAKKLGIDKYYGRDEYDKWKPNNDDFDGMWGVWDGKFLEYFSYELNQMKEPFVSSVFTLSSHHPFAVPIEYEGVFDKGTIPVHQTLGYSDMALRQFFERAKHSDWYNNTIFVVCADHASTNTYEDYQNIMGGFEIPIFIFEPSSEENRKGMIPSLASQIDIMPTVLRYMGYSKPFFSFGFNALAEDDTYFTVNGSGEIYYLYHKNYVLVFNENESLALYDYSKSFSKDIINECELQNTMEKMKNAFLQQYFNRMINNNLKNSK